MKDKYLIFNIGIVAGMKDIMPLLEMKTVLHKLDEGHYHDI
ncbi:hypothetical protein [Bacillus sp. JJ1764]